MKCFIKYLSSFLLMFLASGMIACGGGGGGGDDDPAATQENYSKIATAYSEAISSATESTVNNSNSYHTVTTLQNSSGSVQISTEVCMNSDNELQGVLGQYVFNNFTASNGVILNGMLEYYTTGTDSTVFVLTGTITATGSANGSYVYNILNDGGTLSGYAGIAGYYYNYSTNTTTTTEPDFDVPEKPEITYYCPGLAFTLINGDTEYSVSKGTADATNGICIPATYDGKNVTVIANDAFTNCSLKSVILPNGIKTIGDRAFEYCSQLAKINIPSALTSIGSSAFNQCMKLQISVALPDGFLTIGDNAFDGCNSLLEIIIPESVTSIGKSAIAGNDITVDPDNAFYKSESGILFNKSGTVLIKAICPVKNYIVPNGVITIDDDAFSFKQVENITIPSSVTSIGSGAFRMCALKTITTPNTVTSLGSKAFSECFDLKTVKLSDSITIIESELFSLCMSLETITIPGIVTSIGDSAFSSCRNLATISLPGGITSIGDNAFSDCIKLTAISVPGSVNSIGNYAFSNCTGLVDITLHSGINSIGNRAFSFCSNMTTITLPESITSLGDYLFNGCSKLETVYCNALTPPAILGDCELIYNCPSLSEIYVPSSAVTEYKNNFDWRGVPDEMIVSQ